MTKKGNVRVRRNWMFLRHGDPGNSMLIHLTATATSTAMAIAISALMLISCATQPAAAKCQEGFLFSTGGEVVSLPEMNATGAYGTLIARHGHTWILKTGSVDVSSKGQPIDIGTSSGHWKTIPANSKASLADGDNSHSQSGAHTVNPDSKEIETGITHHDMGGQSKKNKAVQMIMPSDCFFTMLAPYRIRWQSGTAFFYARTGIVIDTNEGIIQAPPGSMFVLSTSFGGVRVMNCNAVCPLTFRLHHREKGVLVAGSEELFVCNHRPLPFEVTPEDGVGRKSIKLTDLGADMIAVTSEFSIPSMMCSPTYVKDWTEAGGSRTQLAADLLKTAAVVSFARRSAETFYVAPRSNQF